MLPHSGLGGVVFRNRVSKQGLGRSDVKAAKLVPLTLWAGREPPSASWDKWALCLIAVITKVVPPEDLIPHDKAAGMLSLGY